MITFYQCIANSDVCASLSASEIVESQLVSLFYQKAQAGANWKPVSVAAARGNGKRKHGDCAYLISCRCPVFSQRAWDALAPLISSTVEALPIQHPTGEPYYFMNVFTVIDALDRDNSELAFYPNGKVMRVRHYCLHTAPLKDKHMFRIPEGDGLVILVSEDFKQRVESSKLKGFGFVQLP